MGKTEQLNECQTLQWDKERRKMNVRQYYGVNRAGKWMADSTMGKQSSTMNVRQYNGVNRAGKWMADNTMGKQSSKMNVRHYNGYNG